ncbi:PGF-CTERM protein [Natronorubrum daqingense]|uniref:PGF-CTERM protein n=3 Tax=Natronorubrum daqingense TaxID=588898 RepID=A0A1N6Z803_9EURY|nr:PGF-CTERM protein [Natronorubrum daqingense]
MGRDFVSGATVSRIGAVMMALIMITSVAAGTAVADTGMEEAEPADEVFVDDDGGAVLVYDEDDGIDDEASGEFGVDISESVAYALVSDEIEDDVSAAFSMVLDNDGLESSGSLAADRPADVEDFSMDVTGEQTESTNDFDANLELALAAADSPPEATADESGSTSGSVVMGADDLATQGEFDVSHNAPPDSPEIGLDMEITETGDDYTLEMAQQNEIVEFETDDWDTEDAAQATLEDEFEVVAQDLGSDVTVTIHDYDFEDDVNAMGDGHLDIEYTIELENAKDGLEQLVAEDLATDPTLDVTQSEADEIAADILDAELETFELAFAEDDTTVDGHWDVAFSGFESSAYAVMDLAEASDEMDDDAADEFDDYEEMYEAQAAADLTETTEWDVTFDAAGGSQEFVVDVTSEADNWDAYTDELADRDIDSPEFVIDAHAETVGDEIDLEMGLEVGQEAIIETAITTMADDLQNDPTVDDDALELVSAFDEADLELMQFDLDMDDGTVTFETGASFDDLGAFEAHLEDGYHGLTVEHIYGDDDAGYVYVTDMADDDDDEDDIREHSIVADDTEIHMPGDWDEDHPRLDMEEVDNYLETDVGDDESDDDDSIPGFGAVAALVALLSIAMWARFDR